MPRRHRARPLKRWRWLGFFSPEMILCAAEVAIGPLGLRLWTLALPDGTLVERTRPRSGPLLSACGSPLGEERLLIADREARIDLVIDGRTGGAPVEVISPYGGGAYAWTVKRGGVAARATIERGGHPPRRIEGSVSLDDSAGYHPRRTAWRWSTGAGRARSGEQVAWNLVEGIHDEATASERTLWIDGKPEEVAPVSFAGDLSSVAFSGGGRLEVRPWAERRDLARLGPIRSRMVQPLGSFSGALPRGLELVEGHGVMEDHEARW